MLSSMRIPVNPSLRHLLSRSTSSSVMELLLLPLHLQHLLLVLLVLDTLDLEVWLIPVTPKLSFTRIPVNLSLRHLLSRSTLSLAKTKLSDVGLGNNQPTYKYAITIV